LKVVMAITGLHLFSRFTLCYACETSQSGVHSVSVNVVDEILSHVGVKA
jgi:hypothetical protein